jgi:hypothetical protein
MIVAPGMKHLDSLDNNRFAQGFAKEEASVLGLARYGVSLDNHKTALLQNEGRQHLPEQAGPVAYDRIAHCRECLMTKS